MATDPKLQNPTESSRPLSNDEYQASIQQLVYHADEFQRNEIAADRERNWRYWRGGTKLKTKDGRNDMVSHDVWEVIESMVPQLMEIFCGCDTVVSFKPTTPSPQDADFAIKATKAVDHIFWSQDGWSKLCDWVRTSLVAKTGIWKVWTEEREDYREDEYEAQSYEELLSMAMSEGVEDIQYLGDQEVFPVSILARTKETERKYWVESLPAEEMLINREALTEEDARIIGQRTVIRVSDLVQMGVPFERAVELRSTEVEDTHTQQERQARRDQVTINEDVVTTDRASWPVKVFDLYVRVDRNGDGYAELRHCIAAGDNINEIVYDGPADYCPYIYTSPIRVPHALIGRCPADVTCDIQDQKTFTRRQIYDNLAWANNPRTAYVDGMVSEADLDDNRYSGKVRTRAPGQIEPLIIPFVADQSLPILEDIDQQRKWRTGVSDESMAMNAEDLQSSTEVGVRAVLGQAQMPVKMIARTLAEDGLKIMFNKLLKLIVDNQVEPLQFQRGDEWIEFAPNGYMPKLNVKTNVGLGNGETDEKLQALGAVAAKQEQILLQSGPMNPWVSPGQYANTLQDMVELSPIHKAPDRYFTPPEVVEAKAQAMAAQAAQKPPPEAIEAQAKAQTAIQQANIKAQADLMEANIQAEQDMKEALLKAETTLRAAMIEAGVAMDEAQLQAVLDAQKRIAETDLKLIELQSEAALEKYKVDQQVTADTRLRSVN